MTRIHDHGEDDPLEFTPEDTPDQTRMWLAQQRFDREVARRSEEKPLQEEVTPA